MKEEQYRREHQPYYLVSPVASIVSSSVTLSLSSLLLSPLCSYIDVLIECEIVE